MRDPDWITYPETKEPPAGLERSLADVEAHLPAGHPYRDRRHITWAHEGTHGVNSRIRGQAIRRVAIAGAGLAGDDVDVPIPAGPGPRHNAAYCLGDRAMLLEEPAFGLADVAAAIPQSLRGISYDLYLRQQARWWADSPLYVLDEWSAYTNGLATAVDAQCNGEFSDVLQPLEFTGYAFALARLCAARKTRITNHLADFVSWQAARVWGLYRATLGSRMASATVGEYLRRLRTAADAEELRVWLIAALDPAVYALVFSSEL